VCSWSLKLPLWVKTCLKKSQKGYKMLDIINQNYRVIYVLSFEIVTILTSCFFFSFHNTNIKKFILKIHLIQF
jgi:hypothetical protein